MTAPRGPAAPRIPITIDKGPVRRTPVLAGLDPDPLTVIAAEQDAWDAGYEAGRSESIPPVVGLLIVGTATFVFGLAIGLTWSAFT